MCNVKEAGDMHYAAVITKALHWYKAQEEK